MNSPSQPTGFVWSFLRLHGPTIIGLLFLGLFPFLTSWPLTGSFLPTYRLFNAMMFGVWLLLTLSMNLLIGYSGQISLGQAALVLIGAYLTAILRQQIGLPFFIALLLAGVVTGMIGRIGIGQPAVRLRGPYLGIATFALAVALPQVLKMKPLLPWTQGVRGIHSTPLMVPATLANLLTAEEWRYYLVLLVVLPLTLAFGNLMRGRLGRALRALREDELVAGQMGINVRRYKTVAFGLSAFYAGVGGGLFFFVQGYVSPDSLGLFDSILLLVAVVIGGLGSFGGSLYGALFLTFQSEVISTLTRWLPNAETMGSMIFGALLISATLLFPQGLTGFSRRLRREPRPLDSKTTDQPQ